VAEDVREVSAREARDDLEEIAARFPGETLRVIAAEGVMTLAGVNATLGYCRYDAASGEVEYVFVGAAFRRKGVATWLLRRVAEAAQKSLVFREPISPMGGQLIAAWARAGERAQRASC
jgi:GNAT superfamily N-acetyltransferase